MGKLTPAARAERNIAWIEKYLRVPEGARAGEPIRLPEFHKSFVRKIYGNAQAPTRRGIFSSPRKSAKTTLCGEILLLHLVGPEARRNSQIIGAANAKDQAAVLFRLTRLMLEQSPALRDHVRILNTRREMHVDAIGTEYRVVAAEAGNLMGLSPIIFLYDELGQVKSPSSDLYDALKTAQSAHAQPLELILSTQAPDDKAILSQLIDAALTGEDPATVIEFHAAPPAADWKDPKVMKACNPGIGVTSELPILLQMQRDAIRMPSQRPGFRNLILNQRIESGAVFIDIGTWRDLAGEIPDLRNFANCTAGLDLSSAGRDLTALVIAGNAEDGRIAVHPTGWLPAEGLREKEKEDKIPWRDYERQGWLRTLEGPVIDYRLLAPQIVELIDDFKVNKLAIDRYAFNYLRPWLLQSGLTAEWIEEHVVKIGQGFVGMTQPIKDFENAVFAGRLVHPDSPILNAAISGAKTVSDGAGNRKFEKTKSASRIDALVAAVMAVHVLETPEEKPPERKRSAIALLAEQRRAG